MRDFINIVEEGSAPVISYTVEEKELVKNQFVVSAYADGKPIGYATFKRGNNDHIRGKTVFRIGYYTIHDPVFRGQGIAQGMVEYFEAQGNTVIPSGAFGAKGKLTDDGFKAAHGRLVRKKPSWLPDDWETKFQQASRE